MIDCLRQFCKLFTVGLIVTDAAVVVPTFTVTVWPWVRSWPAGIPLGSRIPLVLDELGSTPAETTAPEISIPVCVPPPATPACACVPNVAVNPSPELLIALISPAAVFA